MPESAIEIATTRGFIQGVAWAIALIHQHPHGADGMLSESGLRLADFIDAGVEGQDLVRVKAAARIGSVWSRRRANNGDPETIVPAPGAHKKHPAFPGLHNGGSAR